METLAARLKAAREVRGLNQTELADAAGVKQSDVSKLETGRNLTTTAIGRLARALAVPVEWLELGEGAPGWSSAALQSGTTLAGLDGDQETDSTEAHAASHTKLQHPPTAADVGGRQPPVSFDAEFAKMQPSEQRRFLYLWAAAYDDPPDPTGHLGGIPQWDRSTQAPGASPGETPPAKKAPRKNKHRRLG